MTARILPFITKAERDAREAGRRYIEWRVKTSARNRWLVETGQWREPVIADQQTPAAALEDSES